MRGALISVALALGTYLLGYNRGHDQGYDQAQKDTSEEVAEAHRLARCYEAVAKFHDQRTHALKELFFDSEETKE